MRIWNLGAGALVAALAAAPLAAQTQQPGFTVDGDNITMRGCVRPASALGRSAPATLFWSRGDIIMAGIAATTPEAPNPVGTSGVAGRVFYWLEDEEDLATHVGQFVEVKGDLEDFEKGRIEIERKDEFTEIELDLDGKEETARVPTAWLRDGAAEKDQEFDIVTRRIDVDEVTVIGPCNLP